MSKPVCCKCARFFKLVKNDVPFVEQIPRNGTSPRPGRVDHALWRPYTLYSGDLWRCEGCGTEIIHGSGQNPIVHHRERKFANMVERFRPEIFVNDS